MPKKFNTTLPAIMATVSIIKMLIATFLERRVRADVLAPSVSVKKIGAAAGGFSIGSRVAMVNKKLRLKSKNKEVSMEHGLKDRTQGALELLKKSGVVKFIAVHNERVFHALT